MSKQTWFSYNDWKRHNNNVVEAEKFFTPDDCSELIRYMETSGSQCVKHLHTEHTHNGEEKSDTYFWKADCFDGATRLGASLSTFAGVAETVHSMQDAAIRYTRKPMKLAKVIMHRYGPGASGPEHSDVYPLATLLYLNDDYEGGEIYFSSGLELKPSQGSLLVFDGGGVNRHGVRQNSGTVPRYVLVAFWEYEEEDELVRFWNVESREEDDKNNIVSELVSRKSSHHPKASIMFPEIFPILRVDNFISKDLAVAIVKYLNHNDINPEETWGPVCFREYWKVAYPNRAYELPEYTEGVDENTLKSIYEDMQHHVTKFMEIAQEGVAFSKFKGHNHITGAYTPPHTHGPAIAVANLVLHNDYEGGNITIPKYGIEFRADPLTLYVYSEENDLKHGIKEVTSGYRQSLIAHWQHKGHPYDKAGANV
jgi:hypothetical protein